MVKELKIRYSTKVPNAYEVYYEGGGEVPQVLQSSFTDHRTAQVAINNYLTTRPKRGRKADEESSDAV